MKAAFAVIGVAVAFRLVLAGFTGLGIDESYMVAASHSFAASYFDHPLASWWLELAARALTGSAAPIVVRLPFVALSAVSSGLIWAITRRLYGEHAAFWAVVAYTLSPVFSLAAGCWVLPDGPLDAALLAFLYALLRAIGLPSGAPAPRWWLGVGVFAGLALLSKYNAALVFAGAAAAMLLDPVSRRELRRFGPWGAVLLAAVMFTPVIWWNATHGWASFRLPGRARHGIAAAAADAADDSWRRGSVHPALAVAADGVAAAARIFARPRRTRGLAALLGCHRAGGVVCGNRALVLDPHSLPLGRTRIFDAVSGAGGLGRGFHAPAA